MIDSHTRLTGKKSSRLRLTHALDKVVEDLSFLESFSPKNVSKDMTKTFKKIDILTEKLRKNDLNPHAFHANQAYQNTKKKINAYIDNKYNKINLKDNNRIVELLQGRPLTRFYNPSAKLLFDSINQRQIQDLMTNNKRKFGEFWNMTPKASATNRHIELSPLINIPHESKSPRNPELTSFINKLLVKNLGIKQSDKPELFKEKFKSKLFQTERKDNRRKSLNDNELQDEIVILNEEDYLGPEYTSYICDIGNKLRIEKYIGKNSVRKKKMNRQNSRAGRL